jgi:hypothetical protein
MYETFKIQSGLACKLLVQSGNLIDCKADWVRIISAVMNQGNIVDADPWRALSFCVWLGNQRRFQLVK